MGGCLKVVAASLFQWIVALLMGRIGLLLFKMIETPVTQPKWTLGNGLAPVTHLLKGKEVQPQACTISALCLDVSFWNFPVSSLLSDSFFHVGSPA